MADIELVVKLDEVYYEGCVKNRVLATSIVYIVDAIKNGTPLQALEEREEGQWIIEREEETGKMRAFHCSKCYDKTGYFVTTASKFCPECGAKMSLYPIEEWEFMKDGETQ